VSKKPAAFIFGVERLNPSFSVSCFTIPVGTNRVLSALAFNRDSDWIPFSHSACLTERYSLRLFFHERFLAALLCAALPEMHWFKWRYFHKLALLFPQRCCQGHGVANVANRGSKRIPAAGSNNFVLRCWLETDGGGNGTSERQCRSWIQLFRFLAALLKIACGKGTFFIISV